MRGVQGESSGTCLSGLTSGEALCLQGARQDAGWWDPAAPGWAPLRTSEGQGDIGCWSFHGGYVGGDGKHALMHRKLMMAGGGWLLVRSFIYYNCTW